MIHLCFRYRTLFKLWSKSISFVFLLVKWRKNMSLGWRHPCPTHLLVQSTWEISHQSLDFQLINKLILKHFLAQLLFHSEPLDLTIVSYLKGLCDLPHTQTRAMDYCCQDERCALGRISTPAEKVRRETQPHTHRQHHQLLFKERLEVFAALAAHRKSKYISSASHKSRDRETSFTCTQLFAEKSFSSSHWELHVVNTKIIFYPKEKNDYWIQTLKMFHSNKWFPEPSDTISLPSITVVRPPGSKLSKGENWTCSQILRKHGQKGLRAASTLTKRVTK